MLTQKNTKTVSFGLLLAALLLWDFAPAWGSEGVIFRQAVESGDYCHLKFPAIEPGTLGSREPRLENPADRNVIDFYGSCEHDPLSKDEVQTQIREEWSRDNRDG